MSASTTKSLGLPLTGFARERQILSGGVPFSSASLWRKVQSGEFPAPVRISARITAWSCADVHEWFRRMASGKAQPAATPRPTSPGRSSKPKDDERKKSSKRRSPKPESRVKRGARA